MKRDEKKETLVFSDSMCLCSCSCSTRMPCVELLFLQYLAVSGLCDEEIFCMSVFVPGHEMNLCNICALLLLFLFLSFLFLVRYRSFFYVSEFSCFDFSFFFLLSFLIPPERLNVTVVYFSIVEFLCFNFFISL